jgi:CRP-like cAMP-binding protein
VITLGLWGTGEVVSKTLATIKPYQVESLTEVRASLLPISQHPDVTTMLISQIQQMNELAVIRSHKTVEMMLIKLLGWLAQKFGREMNKGQLIDVRLTHQDLADLLASSRVTITRTLSQLEQQGVIQRHPLHRIVLREEDVWHYEI